MKKNNTLSKIIITFALFSIGTSLIVHNIVTPKEVDASQHAGNYNYYVYSGNYYNGFNFNATQGMNGTLRQNLTSKIVPAAFPTYSGSGTDTISDLFQDSEQDPNNSGNMIYFYTRDSVTKTAGTVNGTVIWNREHVWPKSLSNGNWEAKTTGATTKAGTDLLHLRPTYQSTNSSRGNTKYGQTGKSVVKEYEGMTWGYTGNGYFEPLDSNKGDVARIIMYVWTAYKGYSGYNTNNITDVFDSFDTLLTWHTQDKPDVLEGHRNDVAEASLQENRNPFVDHPELAWKIFGDQVSDSVRSACETTYPSSGYNPGQNDEVPATDISITPKTVSLLPNEQRQLSATVTPSDSTDTVSWSSSNTSLATVSNSGKVTVTSTAQAGRTVTITATAGSVSDTCTITIKSSSGDSNGYLLYQDDIVEGDYIIHYDGKNMKATLTSNRLDYLADTPANDTLPSDSDASTIWHIAPSGTYYTLFNASTNKYASSNGTKNQASLSDNGTSDKALWTISKQSDGTFEIVNKYNASAGVNANLRNNGTYGFACYSTSTGGSLSLYKKTAAVVPPEPTAKDEINEIKTRAALSYTCEKTEGSVVTDTLNGAFTGVTGGSYVDWSNKTDTSSAVYAGQSAGTYSSIQLRSKNNNSGIITTTSGGKAAKVTVVWNSNTLAGRQLDVYGKNTAYSSPTDLYGSDSGTLLGTITNGSGTVLSITGDYTYIGIRSKADAIYLDSIEIQWGEPTSFAFTTATVRFRGFLTKALWDQLDIESTITGFGALISTESYLNGTKLETKYTSADGNNVTKVTAKTALPTLLAAGQYDDITEDTYLWNLRRDIPFANFTTNYVAVAFIITEEDGVVFFDEITASVKSIAQDMLDTPELDDESYGGSLSYLANL